MLELADITENVYLNSVRQNPWKASNLVVQEIA